MRKSTSVLINIQRGPSSGVVERDGCGSIWYVWFRQTHESDQIHAREQSVLALHAPRFVSLADYCRILLKTVIINIDQETDLFAGLAIWPADAKSFRLLVLMTVWLSAMSDNASRVAYGAGHIGEYQAIET